MGLIIGIKNASDALALIANPVPGLKDALPCANTIPQLQKFSFLACLQTKKREPDIMFLGDSHTWHFQNAISEQFQNKSVVLIAAAYCLPFTTKIFMTDECRQKYDGVIAYLEQNKSIKTVYLSSYWAFLMSGGFGNGGINWRNASSLTEQAQQSFIENGRYFLSKVLQTNKEIVVLKDIPDLDFNIVACFTARPLQLPYKKTAVNKDCTMDYAAYQLRIAPYEAVLNQLLKEFPQVKRYDPRPLFCKQGQCYAKDKNLPYYFNGDHLNHYGANMLIADMKHKLNIA